MTTFAERLKNAMEQANMSQSALSEQAGASKAAISQYLSGKNTPGPDRIKALADATGVSFDYQMGYGAAPVAEPPIKKNSVPEGKKATLKANSDELIRFSHAPGGFLHADLLDGRFRNRCLLELLHQPHQVP